MKAAVGWGIVHSMPLCKAAGRPGRSLHWRPYRPPYCVRGFQLKLRPLRLYPDPFLVALFQILAPPVSSWRQSRWPKEYVISISQHPLTSINKAQCPPYTSTSYPTFHAYIDYTFLPRRQDCDRMLHHPRSGIRTSVTRFHPHHALMTRSET